MTIELSPITEAEVPAVAELLHANLNENFHGLNHACRFRRRWRDNRPEFAGKRDVDCMRIRNTIATPVLSAIIVPITTVGILAADTFLIVEYPRWQVRQRLEPALGEPTNASP